MMNVHNFLLLKNEQGRKHGLNIIRFGVGCI